MARALKSTDAALIENDLMSTGLTSTVPTDTEIKINKLKIDETVCLESVTVPVPTLVNGSPEPLISESPNGDTPVQIREDDKPIAANNDKEFSKEARQKKKLHEKIFLGGLLDSMLKNKFTLTDAQSVELGEESHVVFEGNYRLGRPSDLQKLTPLTETTEMFAPINTSINTPAKAPRVRFSGTAFFSGVMYNKDGGGPGEKVHKTNVTDIPIHFTGILERDRTASHFEDANEQCPLATSA